MLSRITLILPISLWLALDASGFTITNVLPVNVTPGSFSILWRAADSTPAIEVFADAAGTASLAGQLEIEYSPLHTGNPDLKAGYERRLNQAALRGKTQAMGLMLVRVSGCQPGTTYFYRLSSTPLNGSPQIYPASGPLPGVTTEAESAFVVDDQRLIIDVPGLDTLAQVVLLTNANAAHPLAAVVGDGVGTNQVFFNANDLFTLGTGGGRNLLPVGEELFTARVLGQSGTEIVAQFSLAFSTNFSSLQGLYGSIGTEFLALVIDSAIMRAGQSANIPLSVNTSVGATRLDVDIEVPSGHLGIPGLQALAPEMDPETTTVSLRSPNTWSVHLAARAGQTFSGAKQVAQLAFTALPGEPSAFVPLRLSHLSVTKPDANLVTNLYTRSGRVVVVGNEPLLEASVSAGGVRGLTLYGKPNSSYAVEFATDLASPVLWTRMPYRVPLTAMATPVPGLSPEPARIFYRALEFFADPPVLEPILNPDQSRALQMFGQPGTTYSIQATTNLSNVAAWYPVLTIRLTNSFYSQSVTDTPPAIFYRLKKEH